MAVPRHATNINASAMGNAVLAPFLSLRRNAVASMPISPPRLITNCPAGILDKNWSDYYRGMTIEHEGDPKRSAMSILTGKLADQSALIGVLNSLHDIGYPILSVEHLDRG